MRKPILLLLLSALPMQAQGATLRPATSLAASQVRLSDLFDDLGPGADRVLGPAPAPGGRIVVEAAQLGAIARQFGVDWRPASPGDRAVLDRAGRPVARDELLAVLRDALQGAGAPAGFEFEMPDITPPLVPLESHAKPVVEQLEYDGSSGRFTALLSVSADDQGPVRLRLSGVVQEMVELPVAAHRLLPGGALTADDVRMARVRAATVRGEVARQVAQAVGLGVRTQIAAGQPLPLGDLIRPPLVEKGAAVTLSLTAGGIALTAQGQALEAGAQGERIRVVNPGSRAVVEAEVTGPGRARVEPGSLPITAAARAQVAAR